MQFKNFYEVRMYHELKRIEILEEMSKNMDPIYGMNSTMLDDQCAVKEIALSDYELEHAGRRYRLVNSADLIRNKSRLRIVYLLPHSEETKSILVLIEQSSRLAAKGHDVLLYSHSPQPAWMKCTVPYFVAHPDCRLSDIISGCDIVVAGQWHLAAEAIRVNAALRYHLVQEDFDISGFNALDEYKKAAINAAFCLPLKVITISDMLAEGIGQLFSRASLIIPVPKETDGGHTKERKVSWSKHMNRLEKEFKTSAQSTIQAVRIK